MTELVLLENPRKKKSGPTRKRKSSAAQIAWRKKFAAKFGKKKSKKRSYRKNAVAKTAGKVFSEAGKIRHRPIFYGTTETVGIRSSKAKLNPKKGSKTMAKRHRKKYRRNPPGLLGGFGGGLFSKVKDDVLEIGVAKVADLTLGDLERTVLASVPEKFQGVVKYAISAIGLPMVVSKVFGGKASMINNGLRFRAKMIAYQEIDKLISEYTASGTTSGYLSGANFDSLSSPSYFNASSREYTNSLMN